MATTRTEIPTMADYSARVAERVVAAVQHDDFPNSAAFQEVTGLFTGKNYTVNDTEFLLGMAQGLLRASKVLEERGSDGSGLYAIGLDFLTMASNAYGQVLAMALANTGTPKH